MSVLDSACPVNSGHAVDFKAQRWNQTAWQSRLFLLKTVPAGLLSGR